MKPTTLCQYCGCAEDMIPGLLLNPDTKRCTLCEPEWSDIAARFRDPRTITKHWRAGAAARMASRKAAINAAYAAKTALPEAA
jgi:hypothetical protein